MIDVFGDSDTERESDIGPDSEENLRYISGEIARLRAMVDECEESEESDEMVKRMFRLVGLICDDVFNTVVNPVNALQFY